MNKSTILSIGIAVLLIAGALWLKTGNDAPGDSSTVSMVNGTQIIDLLAKNGYSPNIISAKAGLPTTLRVKTDGTYDCSASLVVSQLSYRKFLEPTGSTDIPISSDKAHGTLSGVCAMGMKSFKIKFN